MNRSERRAPAAHAATRRERLQVEHGLVLDGVEVGVVVRAAAPVVEAAPGVVAPEGAASLVVRPVQGVDHARPAQGVDHARPTLYVVGDGGLVRVTQGGVSGGDAVVSGGGSAAAAPSLDPERELSGYDYINISAQLRRFEGLAGRGGVLLEDLAGVVEGRSWSGSLADGLELEDGEAARGRTWCLQPRLLPMKCAHEGGTGRGWVRGRCGSCPHCELKRRLDWWGRIRYGGDALWGVWESERAAGVKGRLGPGLREMTLTLRTGQGHTTKDMTRCFSNLMAWLRREYTALGSRIEYARVVEFGEKNGMLHVHVLVAGMKYVPQRVLSAKWLEITGTSKVVHISKTGERSRMAAYMAKLGVFRSEKEGKPDLAAYMAKLVKGAGYGAGKHAKLCTFSSGWPKAVGDERPKLVFDGGRARGPAQVLREGVWAASPAGHLVTAACRVEGCAFLVGPKWEADRQLYWAMEHLDKDGLRVSVVPPPLPGHLSAVDVDLLEMPLPDDGAAEPVPVFSWEGGGKRQELGLQPALGLEGGRYAGVTSSARRRVRGYGGDDAAWAAMQGG